MSRGRVAVIGLGCGALPLAVAISNAGLQVDGLDLSKGPEELLIAVTTRSKIGPDEFMNGNISILDCTSALQSVQAMEQV